MSSNTGAASGIRMMGGSIFTVVNQGPLQIHKPSITFAGNATILAPVSTVTTVVTMEAPPASQ